jgi:hypothetical protein
MVASRLHWRLLIGTISLLMAAAFLAPRWLPAPAIQENRILAQKPALPAHLRDLRPFVKAADAYVADQFPIRPHLIAALNWLRMLAGVSGSNRVIIGRDGWLFYDDDTHLGATRNDPPMTASEMRTWLQVLAGRTESLRAKNVPFLMVVPPMKEAIYPLHAPQWYHGLSPERPAVLLSKLAETSEAGEVLYLQAPLAEATQRGWKTFSRHDTHWTGPGAYFGYVALIRRLQALGVTDGPLPIAAFDNMGPDHGGRPRDLALMLGVADFVTLDYPHIDNLRGWTHATKTYLSRKTDWTSPHVIDTGNTGKPVLLMTRDSFSNELLPMLLPHFSRIVLTHNQDGYWRQDLIDRFKPDVVILEVLEGGLRGASGDGPAPSPTVSARIEKALLTVASAPSMERLPPDLAAMFEHAKPAATCNVEAAALDAISPEKLMLTVSGWFAVAADSGSSPHAWVRVQGPGGDYGAQITVDGMRPDVAAALKSSKADRSGFSAQHLLRGLPRERYAIAVYRHSENSWEVCRANTSNHF